MYNNQIPQQPRMPKPKNPGLQMPKYSGLEQQVSSDMNGMTNVTRPAPKRNMNSGALVGDMSPMQSMPNSTLDSMRQQVKRRQMGIQ